MTVTRSNRVALPLAALAVLFGVGLVFTYVVFVQTRLGQRVDDAALAGRAFVPDGFVEDAWTLLDAIGVVTLAGALGIVVLVGLGRGRAWSAVSAGLVVLGANVTTQLLKRVVLTRPDLDVGGSLDLNTLPSGHATVAMSVVVAILFVVPDRIRVPTAVAGWAYATLVGVSTVTAGWHRPSDAVAAAFVVGVWAVVGLFFLTWGEADRVARSADWRTASGTFAVIAVAVVGGVAVLAAASWLGLREVVAWLEEGPLSVGRRTVAYGAAALGIAATWAAVVALTTTALGALFPAAASEFDSRHTIS